MQIMAYYVSSTMKKHPQWKGNAGGKIGGPFRLWTFVVAQFADIPGSALCSLGTPALASREVLAAAGPTVIAVTINGATKAMKSLEENWSITNNHLL